MAKAPIAFRSNPGKYQFIGDTQLINAYAEQMGPDAKDVLAVLPSEGLIEFADTEAGPCRGMIYMEDLDVLYSVHSSTIKKITSAGTVTTIGIFPGVDQVQLSRNQKATPQIFVEGTSGERVIESDVLLSITDPDYPADVVTADFVHGYTVVGTEDRQFNISAINDSLSWDALDFDVFDAQAGKLIRIQEDNGELIGMCSKWMEFYRDTGGADFPFEQLAVKSRGLLAKNSVIKSDSTLMFVGDDNNVYRLENYNPKLIGTHEVSRLVQNDASPSSVIGFSYDREGHKFACFSGTNWTRCYDSATGAWHSRESYHQDIWRARHSVQAFGRTLVGDALSGKIFYLDKDTFTEDGEHLIWKVISPPLHVFPNGAILDAVHFDLATGYGTLTGQGSDPKVMLKTSTDGGNSFGNYRELELGVTGDKGARVTARRLGSFGPKGIVFELSISDPVVRSLVGCDVQFRPLKR